MRMLYKEDGNEDDDGDLMITINLYALSVDETNPRLASTYNRIGFSYKETGQSICLYTSYAYILSIYSSIHPSIHPSIYKSIFDR